MSQNAANAAAKFTLSLRPALRDGRSGFVVSVVGGPQDLIWRGTEEAALRDGAEYVMRTRPELA